jgi:hypothetical protein
MADTLRGSTSIPVQARPLRAKLHRQGQPDVAQADDAHAGLTLADPLEKTFFADAHECASLSK